MNATNSCLAAFAGSAYVHNNNNHHVAARVDKDADKVKGDRDDKSSSSVSVSLVCYYHRVCVCRLLFVCVFSVLLHQVQYQEHISIQHLIQQFSI